MAPRRTTLVVIAALAGLLAACGSGRSDKAGGLTEPATLRIAAHEKHNFFAKLFTDEVRRLSKGRIRVAFIPGTGTTTLPMPTCASPNKCATAPMTSA
jgi:hypothetical protein